MTNTKIKQHNDNDWTMLSQKTQAKISRSYQQNGEQRFEQESLVGTPEEVKRGTAKKYTGEVSHLEWVHTWTDLEREHHKNTTSGVTKIRETRTVQTYDFGDGESVKTTSNPTGQVYKSEEDKAVMDKVDYLKNMHDQLDNRETAHDISNKSDKTAMWIVIVAVGILATAAVLFTLLR